MIIKRFIAKDVYDYYNFDFVFNEKINFLIGLNGSGKTTAIKMIQSIIFFDFEYFSRTSFSRAIVEVQSVNLNTYLLEVTKNNNEIIFSINGSQEIILFNERAFQSNFKSSITTRVTDDDLSKYFERERFNLINKNPVFSKFNSLEKPIFLGLERTLDKYYDEDYLSTRPARFHSSGQKIYDVALRTSIYLFESYFKKYKRSREISNRRMLDIAFDSFFNYHSINFDKYFSKESIDQMFEIINREREIYEVIESIDRNSKYWNRAENLLKNLRTDKLQYEKEGKLTLELCFNLIQTNGLNEILKEFDKNKKNAEARYKPIKDFIDSINFFFKHSGKYLSIDELGEMKIYRGNKLIEVSTLSSGEKQLIMLLAHSNFGVKTNGSFIIDEPELSLHLGWQEALIQNITKNNDSTQYIFATHSPEIVGSNIEHCIYLESN